MRGGTSTHSRPAAWTTRRGLGTAVGGLLAILVLGGLVLGGLGGGALGGSRAAAAPVVLGLDVSDHQPRVDWSLVRAHGAQFAYVKATQGTGFVSATFAAQYDGAAQAGLIRGAYHFALPSQSGGGAQARFFVAHGGGWTADGRTLPGAVDLEANPYGARCYGLSQPAMVAWIARFTATYHALTSRWPVIYTTSDWWAACTGDNAGFGGRDALWIASAGVPPLPPGWTRDTFRQFTEAGPFPGDQDSFNGSRSRLLRLATGG
jgi:GH25 family lysozyme M1 (1,4-beta-N-acetylmuramidase)